MSLYESFLKPLLFRVPAETAHEIGAAFLRAGFAIPPVRSAVASRCARDSPGPVERFGLTFPNPLGVAAGFDKNGKLVRELAALGFGFVEVGTVTLRPQEGNPRPRLFRLPKDLALINRLGFNNEGAEAVAERLSRMDRECVVGVNIGRNKDVENRDAVENYLATFRIVHSVADYIAVNVSSPNTPGLRELQERSALDELLSALSECNAGFETRRPILLKIAPDLDDRQIATVVDAAKRNGIEGIIATNTTISRDGLSTSPEEIERIGDGGLSGRPVCDRSTEVIGKIRKASGGEIPVIGVGGIFTAEDAFAKISAGACLVQAYTGFVYRGPGFAREINRGLQRILNAKGLESIDEAVGIGML
ncbi:MAG: quinone-dependent dihydroorotate dehydrogenase [Acidobacteriota bacterium]|nr:MAG: quinone-dependent dihydroorotate dehydrogenase [Acidobacteriota bacterium]